jgi:hypothetical protein
MSLLDDTEIEDFWRTAAAAGSAENDFNISEVEPQPISAGV